MNKLVFDLKFSFIISIIFHILIIITFTKFKPEKNITYVAIPIELVNTYAAKQIHDSLLKDILKDPVIKKKSQIKDTVEQKKYRSRVISNSSKKKLLPKIQNLLEFPYAYYIKIIETRITKNWEFPKSVTSNVKAILYFVIGSQGEILSYKLHKQSGNEIFDQAVLTTIKLIKSFPPLPDGYTDKTLGVYFAFEFEN